MNNYKIVILNSNDQEMKELKEELLHSEQFEIVGTFKDGLAGVEFLKNNQANLVVLDLILENYDGFEVLEQIKSCNLNCKTLVVSSLKDPGFAQKALDLGAGYFLVRPVSTEVLTKRCLALLESKPQASKRRSLDERLGNIFITVGIPAHIKGYQFLREAVKMAIDEPEIINAITKQLYPSIASRFDTSASKVERAIRHAIEVAWNRGKIENINEVFGLKIYTSNEKPTNGEFIALVADKLLMEGA